MLLLLLLLLPCRQFAAMLLTYCRHAAVFCRAAAAIERHYAITPRYASYYADMPPARYYISARGATPVSLLLRRAPCRHF